MHFGTAISDEILSIIYCEIFVKCAICEFALLELGYFNHSEFS